MRIVPALDNHQTQEPTPPALRNVHVEAMQADGRIGRMNFVTDMVQFQLRDGATLGGHRITSHYWWGNRMESTIQTYRRNAAERVAAAALHDAIIGSGFLQLPLRENDWQLPELGRTRIYVDRRSRFLEFDAAAPPPVALAVLDAIRGYRDAVLGGHAGGTVAASTS